MKRSLITYVFKVGPRDEWHHKVAAFIAALDSEPDLKGRIAYRCIKERDGDRYYHLASAVDDDAVKTLQTKPFFREYQAETRRVAGGEVQVLGLEEIAGTQFRD
jgi:hypothetical protein